jgi:hypothetical protein
VEAKWSALGFLSGPPLIFLFASLSAVCIFFILRKRHRARHRAKFWLSLGLCVLSLSMNYYWALIQSVASLALTDGKGPLPMIYPLTEGDWMGFIQGLQSDYRPYLQFAFVIAYLSWISSWPINDLLGPHKHKKTMLSKLTEHVYEKLRERFFNEPKYRLEVLDIKLANEIRSKLYFLVKLGLLGA